MEENKLTKEKFIELLKENVHDFDVDLQMVIVPSEGWLYELGAYVTNIVFEPKDYDTAFISNAFSDENPVMTVQDIIDELSERECKYVAFEIYVLNKKTNTYEQIVSTSSDKLTIISINDINTYEMIIEIDAI